MAFRTYTVAIKVRMSTQRQMQRQSVCHLNIRKSEYPERLAGRKFAGGIGASCHDPAETCTYTFRRKLFLPCSCSTSFVLSCSFLFSPSSTTMASTAFRVRTLARVAGPLRRGFATSLARGKNTQGLKKLYDSADEAVSDIPSGSTILSGGASSILLRTG